MRVNEIFSSIQGEGILMGVPSTFIRLQGCSVGCSWCDTKHTWKADEEFKVNFVDIVQQPEDRPLVQWGNAEPEEVANAVAADFDDNQHIVITGGEPLEQVEDVAELCQRLIESGRTVQIETSGYGGDASLIPAGVWMTLSPKVDMERTSPIPVHHESGYNELKVVIDAKVDSFEKYREYFNAAKYQYHWLQPVSQSDKAYDNCLRIARQLNLADGKKHWRVGMQMHKYLDVR